VAFFLICGLAFLFAAWLISQPWLLAKRRARIRVRPFPVAWRRFLQERVPYVASLPADLQLQLKQHIQVFLAEKPFLACGGLVLTQEMRVVIAAQACLLILNRPATYFPNLRQILVYPGPFVVNRVRAESSGVLQDLRQVLSGESWSQGQVILSWEDVLDGAADPRDGRNVVVHEFAHQLDQETGQANGAPQLGARADRGRWLKTFTAEFALLQQRTEVARADPAGPDDSLLSDYGATSPAEFFAVASEVFFERPQRMSLEHATLYEEMRRFYCVDPLSW
jgi:Mlc titration factor MtfA (ptsG expression regulator)